MDLGWRPNRHRIDTEWEQVDIGKSIEMARTATVILVNNGQIGQNDHATLRIVMREVMFTKKNYGLLKI